MLNYLRVIVDTNERWIETKMVASSASIGRHDVVKVIINPEIDWNGMGDTVLGQINLMVCIEESVATFLRKYMVSHGFPEWTDDLRVRSSKTELDYFNINPPW